MKLIVKAKKQGFRRLGIAWSATETVIDTEDYSKAQVETLKNDPDLVVVEAGTEKGLSNQGGDGKQDKAEITALKKQLTEATKQVEKAEGKVTDLEAKLTETEAKITALEAQLKDAEAKEIPPEKMVKETGKADGNKAGGGKK